jgi:hypothetical protein
MSPKKCDVPSSVPARLDAMRYQWLMVSDITLPELESPSSVNINNKPEDFCDDCLSSPGKCLQRSLQKTLPRRELSLELDDDSDCEDYERQDATVPRRGILLREKNFRTPHSSSYTADGERVRDQERVFRFEI